MNSVLPASASASGASSIAIAHPICHQTPHPADLDVHRLDLGLGRRTQHPPSRGHAGAPHDPTHRASRLRTQRPRRSTGASAARPTGSRPGFIDRVLALCRDCSFTPVVAQEVGDVVLAIDLVATGFGACLMPCSTTSLGVPGVVYRR